MNTNTISFVLEAIVFSVFAYKVLIKKERSVLNGFVLGIFTINLIKTTAKIAAYIMSK